MVLPVVIAPELHWPPVITVGKTNLAHHMAETRDCIAAKLGGLPYIFPEIKEPPWVPVAAWVGVLRQLGPLENYSGWPDPKGGDSLDSQQQIFFSMWLGAWKTGKSAAEALKYAVDYGRAQGFKYVFVQNWCRNFGEGMHDDLAVPTNEAEPGWSTFAARIPLLEAWAAAAKRLLQLQPEPAPVAELRAGFQAATKQTMPLEAARMGWARGQGLSDADAKALGSPPAKGFSSMPLTASSSAIPKTLSVVGVLQGQRPRIALSMGPSVTSSTPYLDFAPVTRPGTVPLQTRSVGSGVPVTHLAAGGGIGAVAGAAIGGLVAKSILGAVIGGVAGAIAGAGAGYGVAQL